MAKKRSTFSVEALKARVNHALAYEEPHGLAARAGALNEGERVAQRLAEASLLESVLHETGNYQGFRYLQAHELPQGSKPGIIYDPDGGNNHQFPDPSRRLYY